MNAENKFLRTVCRVALNETEHQIVVDDSVFDEDKLYNLGLYHQIIPLIADYRTILSQIFPALSDAFFEKCRLNALESAGRMIIFEKFLANIAQLFCTAGIEYRLIKGPVLAYELYEFPYQRPFGDLDILIQPESLEKVHTILGELSCDLDDDLYINFPDEIIKKYGFARHYISVKNPLVAIDVHISLSSRLHPFQFDLADFWSHSRPFKIGDREYQTFDWPHQALYLLYHAFKHYYFKLIWIIDCRQNLRLPDFDKSSLLYLLKKYNLTRLWNIYTQISSDLWNDSPQLLESREIKCTGVSSKINTEMILQGGLHTSLARARMLLPMIYLSKLSQKIAYLGRQMFPPRDVVWDFYTSPDLKPTWRNYLRLRYKAICELFRK
ncbi:MAG TPA: nucleotidyltransferase family protein [Candidatus Marinimicrobia bacterium]|nr:nucleotidyltransferase family protein [Candidatus Neomarinimicrobiota bacterium]HRS51836.1 nucleotidyltransferase family protein [Candidatus Neomarinimicrobiota bacterium]HRU92703.1 nucleotidyltransferase family protein [Candidatus Neomarinimicrobiota bacterium]